jgi:tetratricopeptide (TPR) repeat protein
MNTRTFTLLIFAAIFTGILQSCRSQYTLSERMMNRGVRCKEKEKYQEALLWLNRSIANDSLNLDAYLNRGCVFDDLGMYEESLNDYRFLFSKGYRNSALYYNTGLVLHAKKQYGESLAMYDSALRQEPHPDFYIARGTSLCDLGQHEAAIGSYDQAYALNPDDLVLLYDYGYTYFKLQNLEKAEHYLQLANSKRSKDENVYLYLAKIYQLRKKPDIACMYYKKALKLQPNGMEFAIEDQMNCD